MLRPTQGNGEDNTNRRSRYLLLATGLLVALLALSGCAPHAPTSSESLPDVVPSTTASQTAPITFAVVGDYGVNDWHELAVSRLVASWLPAFVITAGDNYYSQAGGTGLGRYEKAVGTYYGAWISGAPTGASAASAPRAPVNAFFPTLGNHDYTDAPPGPETYLAYFTLPGAGFANSSGSERYYDYVEGPVHFFVLNSNPEEPDGVTATSRQAQWLQRELAASTSPWNIVYEHHPPYSSDSKHGPTTYMQWPYAAWGADAVISGHVHSYERIQRDGIVYFINGMGGEAELYTFGQPVQGSMVRYGADWGAQKVTATASTLDFKFYNILGALIDEYQVSKP